MLCIPALSPGEFRLIYMKNTRSPRGQSVWRKNFRAERLKAGRRGATAGGLGRTGLTLARALVAVQPQLVTMPPCW